MMELVAECARNNRASKSKYSKVWKALVACTEGVLSSGRGVIVEKVSTRAGSTQSNPTLGPGVRASEAPRSLRPCRSVPDSGKAKNNIIAYLGSRVHAKIIRRPALRRKMPNCCCSFASAVQERVSSVWLCRQEPKNPSPNVA